jgi:F5/8 type C domain-containing protein
MSVDYLTARIRHLPHRLSKARKGRMQKTILGNQNQDSGPFGDPWFGIDAIAGIGVTSEAEGASVESVFDLDSETGWRAENSGLQVIRITFGEPKTIRRIQLEFRESQFERTQEFTLHATAAGGERTEVIRQQWTFSPQGSTQEVEQGSLMKFAGSGL